MKLSSYVLCAFTLCVGLAVPAYADTVSFTLDNASLSGTAGDTITFSATITTPAGNGADVYLNGLSITDMSPLTTDITDFLLNFPFTLGISDSASGELFTVTLPGSPAAGTYYGTVTLLGGGDGGAQDELGSQLFSVTVAGDAGVTPEPGSLLLVVTGLSGALASRKLRRHFR